MAAGKAVVWRYLQISADRKEPGSGTKEMGVG
jgi:hypothetical protein